MPDETVELGLAECPAEGCRELKPAYDRLLSEIRRAEAVYADETRWQAHYEARLDRLLARRSTDPDEVRISKTLRRYRDEWFVFLVEEVEPNTNPAEGAIKPWAVNRYVSHGSRSKRGPTGWRWS